MGTMPQRRRRWATRTEWMLAAMVVCACGDDGTPGTSPSETDGTATEGQTSTSGVDGTETDPATTAMTTATDESSDTGNDTDDPPPPPPAAGCDPLPPPEGDVVQLSPADDLSDAIADAPTGRTLVLADGIYDVSGESFLVFDTPGVTLRSASGDPSSVIIDGGYSIGSILNVRASDVTIAEVTLQRPMWHPIHVTGGMTSNTENTLIYRVRAIDPGEQAIKINASSEGFYSDGGTVACSHLELTDEGRDEVSNCYTGGIDCHLGWGWEIRDNTIEGFWCDQGLSEHAIHFWNGARDTLVERNVITDCARGVGFGLGEGGNGSTRDYGDDPCPAVDGYVGHYGGIIRNNTVFAARPELFESQSGFDSGIALEQACESQAVHNTVVSLQQPFTTIEYRFPNTNVTIANNLVTHSIMERNGAQATLMGNLSDQGTEHFVDGMGGDLHLVAASSAVDGGVALPAGLADEDIDGDARDGSPDVGADEL